ncbi:MAG TPA: GAF domain-containing protein [Candidatus Limnocylindrales bacterium]|nr:GAF domain-containing protein [Candidatus Limnocylindrales bacterium]
MSGDPAAGPGTSPGGAAAAAALAAVRAVAARATVAERLEAPAGEAILRSVVDAAAVLIRAEAASIALFDSETGRLVFRVAAGEHGQGVIGLAVQPGEGVAGYVYSSGQPLAIGEATVDPRFRRDAAEQTGYVPKSLLAVPLADAAGTIGVLEVLDRRDGAPFDLADLEAAAVFARQATVAIRSTRLERDVAGLLRAALIAITGPHEPGSPDAGLDVSEIDALVSVAAGSLDDENAEGDGGTRTGVWRLADAVARARLAAPEQVELVADILEALARRAEPAGGRYRRAPRR